MRATDPNLPQLQRIAGALGDLREQVVFVGDSVAGLRIRLLSAVAFVATKLEAFASRGKGDFLASHDLEDVLNVVDGRDELVEELRAAPAALRAAVARTFASLLAQPDFLNVLAGLIAEPERAGEVLARLREMC